VAQCDASGERRVRPFTGRFEAVEAREVVGDVLVGLDLVPAGDRRLVVRAPVLAVARRRVRVPVGTPLFEIGYTVGSSAVTVEGPEEPDSTELLPSSPPLSLPVPPLSLSLHPARPAVPMAADVSRYFRRDTALA